MSIAPIVVTVYHRPDCFARCIEALRSNVLAPLSELYVLSDAPSKPEHEALVNQVRDYARTITGFKHVHLHFRETNCGGHESVIRGFKDVFATHDRLVFLEDDIIVAKDFLQYLNDGLEFFKENKKVFSIAAYKRPFRIPHAYKHDVFFLENYSPWGFGIWKDRFCSVDISDFDRYSLLLSKSALYKRLQEDEPMFLAILKADSSGRMKALDARFEYHIHMNQLFSIFPVMARATNIGFDARGEHCGGGGSFLHVRLSDALKRVNFDAPVTLDRKIEKRFYAAAKPNVLFRVYRTVLNCGIKAAVSYYRGRAFAKIAASISKHG